MDRARWRQLEEHWEQAEALPPAERARFLDALAEHDEALAAELGRLLDDAREDSFLRRPAFAAEDRAAEDRAAEDRAAEDRAVDDPWLGRRLGRYLLLECIGEGGMGRVYLAREEGEDFERHVAVKLLRGVQLPDLERRLATERRILASLAHPNIARFLDGGRSEEGVSFVVMDHVDGQPITEFCRTAQLDLHAVLGLFRKACDAVAYAHARLVIHRDLKPANLLVTREGEPRLLDFGLAKLLDAGGEPTGDHTETQYRALTPNYASPEQIAGRAVTTATDVYSLGVMLYELLTGTRPFEHAGRSSAAIEQALEAGPAPRPSERLAASDRGRGEDRPAWRTLPGDLDRIVMKALAFEPELRYASVEALAEDVDRFLGGMPVRARPRTWGYRAQKFVRRNRTAAVLGLLLGVFALVFALTASIQALRLRAERNAALMAQARAEEAVAFVERVFQIQDPRSESASRGGTEELLDAQRDRVLSELADQPELQVRLASTLGLIYRNQGLLERARDLLERTVELARRVHGPEHLQTARARSSLGMVQTDLGEYEASERSFLEAIEVLERHLPESRADLGLALSSLGQLYRVEGRTDSAEGPLRRSVELAEPEGGTVLAHRLGHLATVRQRQGDLEEAEALARRAVDISWSLAGGEMALAETSNALGEVLRNKTEYREAEEHLRRALEIYRRRLGHDPLTAAVLNNLGVVLRSRGDYREARAAYAEGLEIMREIHGDEHFFVAVHLGNLGRLERFLGDFAASQEHIEAALAIFHREVGDAHPNVGLNLKALAELRRDQGRVSEALELVRRADEVLAGHVGPEHPWRATTRVAEGGILADLGRFDEAEARLASAREALEAALGPEASPLAGVRAELAALRKAQGRLEASASLYREAEAVWRKSDPEHPEGARCAAALAEVYRLQGRPDAARRELAGALPILRGALLPGHPALEAAERTMRLLALA